MQPGSARVSVRRAYRFWSGRYESIPGEIPGVPDGLSETTSVQGVPDVQRRRGCAPYGSSDTHTSKAFADPARDLGSRAPLRSSPRAPRNIGHRPLRRRPTPRGLRSLLNIGFPSHARGDEARLVGRRLPHRITRPKRDSSRVAGDGPSALPSRHVATRGTQMVPRHRNELHRRRQLVVASALWVRSSCATATPSLRCASRSTRRRTFCRR